MQKERYKIFVQKKIEKIYNITNMLNNELKKNNKVEIDNLVENLNEVTNLCGKIVNKNFKNFVGKDIDTEQNDQNYFYLSRWDRKRSDAQNGLSLLR